MSRRIPRKRHSQVEMTFPTWGGKRDGAGRPRNALRPRVPHIPRPKLASRFPVHVTVRVRPDVPRLRGFSQARVLKEAFVRTCDKGVFRICQFSVQGNHLHLVCEARDAEALARGIQGWKTSVARRMNRHFDRRGTFWDDRYHAVILRTPAQTRAALNYVLGNARRHGEPLPSGDPDLLSSAWYFDGWADDSWRDAVVPPDNPVRPPVAAPATWLLNVGWRRCRLIRPDERPR